MQGFRMTYKNRCIDNNPSQELYASYHDNEWDIPKYDHRENFELLILEGISIGT